DRAMVLLSRRDRRELAELSEHRTDGARHPAPLRSAAGRPARHSPPRAPFTAEVDGLSHRYGAPAARPADRQAKPRAQSHGDAGRSPRSLADPGHARVWSRKPCRMSGRGRRSGRGRGMNPRVLHVTTVPLTLPFLAGHVAHAKREGFEVHALSSPGEP